MPERDEQAWAPLSQDRVLDVACELFVREGALKVSLRRVASVLGVTPMALYRYVDNKEDLFAGVLRRGYEEFDGYLSRGSEKRHGLSRLKGVTEGFCAFALNRGSYFDLMFLGRSLPGGQGESESVREVALPTFKLLRDCVREAVEAGELEVIDPQKGAVTLLAQATGIIALHRTGLFGWSNTEARCELLGAVEQVVASFKPSPRQESSGP